MFIVLRNKKISTIISFVILFSINNSANAKYWADTLRNDKFKITILVTKKEDKGSAVGKNLIALNGYSVEEILGIFFPNRTHFDNTYPQHLTKYDIRVEGKKSKSRLKLDASVMGLLAKYFKFEFRTVPKQIRYCKFDIVNNHIWQKAQQKLESPDEGVAKKIIANKLFCYDCTLNDIAEVYSSTNVCIFEDENLNKNAKLIVEINKMEKNLLTKGLKIRHYNKNIDSFVVHFKDK